MVLYLQSRLLVFPSDDAALVRAYGNADFQCLFRKNALDILRPFDEAQAAAVDIVVEAYVESLFRAGDSVEVEVEYRISVRSLVFIDNGKGRRAYGIFLYAQPVAEGSGKCRLACTHRCVKCDDAMTGSLFQEFVGSLADMRQVIYDNFVFHLLDITIAGTNLHKFNGFYVSLSE